MSDVSFTEFLKRSKFDFKKAKKYKDDYDKIMGAGLFDKNFYITSYPHIKNSGMDPLVHYLFYGYKEGKLPNVFFDSERYIKEFPEIQEKNLNPLIYYIDKGHKGFMLDENPFSVKKERIINTNKVFLNNFQFDEEPLVSIIVLNRNGLNHLKVLFNDFNQKTNYNNYEIIVVDNASCDESVEYLYSLDLPIKIIENAENVSFSKGNNDAAKIAKGKYLLLLNNDIEPTYGWLNEMVGVAENMENVGAVGAKLIFPYYNDIENQAKSFSIQHAGVKFREEITPYIYGPYHENMYNTLLFTEDLNELKEVLSNTAACILIPKDIYDELEGLDEEYIYGYEDIDFAFRLREKGYKSIFNPQALLLHHESATREEDNEKKNFLNYKNIMHFYEKWGNQLFKEILEDKLSEKFFLTSKKINIAVVARDFNNNLKEFIQELNMKYNVIFISDFENLDLGKDCDIAILFDDDYEIDATIARLNLIKVIIKDTNLILKGIESINTKDEVFKIKSTTGKDLAIETLDIIKGNYLGASD